MRFLSGSHSVHMSSLSALSRGRVRRRAGVLIAAIVLVVPVSLSLAGVAFAGSGVPVQVAATFTPTGAGVGTLTVSGKYTCNDVNNQGGAVFLAPNAPDATIDSLQRAIYGRPENQFDIFTNCTTKSTAGFPFSLTYTNYPTPADSDQFCLAVYHRKGINGSNPNITADGSLRNTDNSYENNGRKYSTASCARIPKIRTTATSGGSNDNIHDTATISGAPASLVGTVAFKASKDDNTCATSTFTSSKSLTLDATGGGSVASDNIPKPVATGTYYWTATFTSGTFTLSTQCLDTGETSTLSNPPTTVNTGQKVVVRDFAQVNNYIAGGTGTVTFRLYSRTNPAVASCNAAAGELIYTSSAITPSATGTANTSQSTNLPPTLPLSQANSAAVNNTWDWTVTFSADAFNSGSTSPCGTESVSLGGNTPGVDP